MSVGVQCEDYDMSPTVAAGALDTERSTVKLNSVASQKEGARIINTRSSMNNQTKQSYEAKATAANRSIQFDKIKTPPVNEHSHEVPSERKSDSNRKPAADAPLRQSSVISSPMEDYANTKKMLMNGTGLDEDRMLNLRIRFDKVMSSVRVPDTVKQPDSIYQWNVPKHIISFLQNILEDQINTIKLIPWNEFKITLYDYYDHRIANQAEISGAINNYYVNMDENVMLYFLDKFKYRRNAE